MFRAIRGEGGAGGRWPVLLLAIGFLLLVGVGGATAWMVREARIQNERVSHTMEVRAVASDLFIALLNAETGQRGYMLTGVATYRDVSRKGVAEAPRALARLKKMVADNPRQQAAIARIEPIARERLAIVERTTALTDRGDRAAAVAIVRSGRGKALMDRLRREIAAVQAEEDRLLLARRADADRTAEYLLLLAISGLAIAAALAFAAIAAMLRYARSLEQANEEVRSLNEGLEATVAERTADLQAANEEIQRFAYIVSHDLRSPLVNVMGFTAELQAAGEQARDLLARAGEIATKEHRLAIEEDLPEALGFIRTSTARMDRLINAILTLSRQGRRTLAPETVDMGRLIEDIAAGLHQQIEAAGATLKIARLPSVVSDRLALEQIFGNLLDNAVKYLSSDRPGLIEVEARPLPGDQVAFAVRDNGRGVDIADRERVFDLFRRAGVQDKPGEGIGLAHVRALVRRLGGNITLESELGRGSCFTVTLPRVLKGSAGE